MIILEAKGKGTKANQAMRLCMKSTRGMPTKWGAYPLSVYKMGVG